jgi:hypothetical protein
VPGVLLRSAALFLGICLVASGGAAQEKEANPAIPPALSGAGTTDYLPLWTNSTTLGSSVLFQSGSGASAKVGINTATPATTLDVKGAETVRGILTLPASGSATASSGFPSQSLKLAASSFSSASSTAANYFFDWAAEPAGNNTSNPTATLNLLFGSGSGTAAQTGLRISNKGLITFAAGQTFPGTGHGTVTSIATGAGLAGGPITTTGTLKIDPTVVPLLNATNTFTGNQTINGNLLTGVVFAGGLNLNSTYGESVGMTANPNANGVGYPLMLSAGSANIGTSNAPGGDLYLSAGLGTGLGGGGNVHIQAAPAGPTGTSFVYPVDRQFIPASAVSMGGNYGAGPAIGLQLQNGTGGGLLVHFAIYASDASGTVVAAATGSCTMALTTLLDGTAYISILFGDYTDISNNVNASCLEAGFGPALGFYVADSLTFDPALYHKLYYQVENISGLQLHVKDLNLPEAQRDARSKATRADAQHPRITVHHPAASNATP